MLSVFLVILAINTFLANKSSDDPLIVQEIYLTVCLHRLADLVKEIEV